MDGACRIALRPREDPLRDRLEHHRRHRLLDLRVLAGQAGLARLEEVVQIRKRADRRVRVATGLEGGLDRRQVLLERHLDVLLAVQGEGRNLDRP